MAKEDFDFDFEPWMAEELIHRSEDRKSVGRERV